VRDPELLKRAHQAAAGIERAWYRWRAGQGLLNEPMPTVSSYVGYSLEERGEPRVVFGMTAGDAERLAALLEQRVHGAMRRPPAAMPSGPVVAAATSGGLPLPVPPQAPSVVAEQARPWQSQPRFPAPADVAPGATDGPVYRELAAAQGLLPPRQAPGGAVTGDAAAADHAEDERPAAESEPVPDDAASPAASVSDGDGEEPREDDAPGDETPDAALTDDLAQPGAAAADEGSGEEPASGPSDGGSGQAEPPHGPGEGGGSAPVKGDRPESPAAVGTHSDPSGTDLSHDSQHAAFVANDGAAGDEATGQHVPLLFGPAVRPGAGPLALAASAARLEAEARIRAAAVEATSEAADASNEGKRPESGSGARTHWHAHGGHPNGGHGHGGSGSDDQDATQPDLTSVLGRPGVRARSGRVPRGIAAAAQVGRRVPGLRATS
jgi:hypothetical protein